MGHGCGGIEIGVITGWTVLGWVLGGSIRWTLDEYHERRATGNFGVYLCYMVTIMNTSLSLYAHSA
jgi:hypothetical protein